MTPLEAFYTRLVAEQEDLPDDAAAVLYANLWALYDEEPVTVTKAADGTVTFRVTHE